MPPSPLISAFIITYNEQDNLQACLESLSFCDEIIVVDSESIDKTREIAEECGAKVIIQPFLGYRDQKQYALEQCAHDWVLSIDADEVISDALREEILSLDYLDSGYEMPRLHYFKGQKLKHGGLWPDYKLRLFKKNQGEFVGDNIHEVIEVNGPTAKLKAPLLHYSWRDYDDFWQRQKNYAGKVAQARYAAGRFSNIFDLIIKPIYTFIHRYIIRLGILDGYWGLLFAFGFAYFSGYKAYRLLQTYLINHPSEKWRILCRPLLIPVTWDYWILSSLRNWLYNTNIASSYQSKIPIISIGNLSTGGTGKTPLVQALAQHAKAQGKKPVIITRGYKSKVKKTPLHVNNLNDLTGIADEPRYLSEYADLIISPRRAQGIQYAEERLQPDLIILDDGYQHRAVERDLNICLIDCSDSLTLDLLPAGNLRELFSNISRADLIVLTRSQYKPTLTERIKGEIKKHAPNTSIYELHDQFANIKDQSGKEYNINELKGKELISFCGIGNPEQFRKLLESAELNIKDHHNYPDHHAYTGSEISELESLSADYLLTTIKDAVKIDKPVENLLIVEHEFRGLDELLEACEEVYN